jgi:SWI/SNF-related matrix-associated actin-dependent regulator 1 of chromatin subfamily A
MALKLKPYQKETIRGITHFDGRSLVALDMGLGKTIISLRWLVRNDACPAIVVCPASVKWQWQDEAWEQCGLSSIVVTGRSPEGKMTVNPKRFDLIIINYDILDGWVDWIRENFKPTTIVLDECHNCKNWLAKRSKAVKRLARKVPHILALSGTPLTNRPVELWFIANLLWPDTFSSFTSFTNQYCQRRRTRWGWQYRGAKNLDKLHKKLKRAGMIRYRKKDVLKELPDKTRHIIPVDIICRLEYLRKEQGTVRWLQAMRKNKTKSNVAEAFTKLTILRHKAAELKLNSAFNWIDNFLAESDQKLVVFAWHKNIVRKIRERYNSATITGETLPQDRRREVRKFMHNPKCRVFCGNIKAAGSGIDGLQRVASDVVFLELPWTPADLVQAEDRLFRIGQARGVNVHIIIAKDTVEQEVMKILQTKQAIFDQTLDGKESTELAIFDQLVQALTKGRRR